MSYYGGNDMYISPSQRFGKGGETKKKAKSATQLALSKGSSKTTVKASEFRYASIWHALRAIAHELGDVTINERTLKPSFSKASVLMIASALEYHLKKLLRDANSFTTFTRRKTVSVAALERAAEARGIPTDILRTDTRQALDTDAVHKEMSKRGPMTKEERESRRAERSAAYAAIYKTFKDKKDKKNMDDGYSMTANAITRASVKRLLDITGAERGSTANLQVVLVNIGYVFLRSLVRSMLAVLAMKKAVRVNDSIARQILQGAGIASVGFSGFAKMEHQKRMKSSHEALKRELIPEVELP
jgi:histone H3/H4